MMRLDFPILKAVADGRYDVGAGAAGWQGRAASPAANLVVEARDALERIEELEGKVLSLTEALRRAAQ